MVINTVFPSEAPDVQWKFLDAPVGIDTQDINAGTVCFHHVDFRRINAC